VVKEVMLVLTLALTFLVRTCKQTVTQDGRGDMSAPHLQAKVTERIACNENQAEMRGGTSD